MPKDVKPKFKASVLTTGGIVDGLKCCQSKIFNGDYFRNNFHKNEDVESLTVKSCIE
jgi:hypothetical protein